MTETINEPILEGSLADFNLIEVLQVLSMGRQYTRVEVFGDDSSPTGTIFIKSGKVVQAACGARRGRLAFINLIRRPPSRFRVFRIAMPALIPEPVGSLCSLVIEAIDASSLPANSVAPPSAAKITPTSQLTAAAPTRARSQTPRTRMNSGFQSTQASAGPQIIAIASPKGGSGKTTVALNLALSLARRELSVILVDGDVNGDVMSSIDERASARAGVFDILSGTAEPVDALRKTLVPNLKILPAVGQALPNPELAFVDYRDRWRALLDDLAQRASIVLVDTPAGMFGMTYQILSGCTHVLGVLQAEVIAQRSFTVFSDCLNMVPEANRPQVLGIFLNMLQLQHQVSIDVLARACESLPKHWLFETLIPRNAAFLDATALGLPLHLYDPKQPPAVSWLFDTLASEVMERLGSQSRVAERQQRSFLA
jgi:chromosome partitioning protein